MHTRTSSLTQLSRSPRWKKKKRTETENKTKRKENPKNRNKQNKIINNKLNKRRRRGRSLKKLHALKLDDSLALHLKPVDRLNRITEATSGIARRRSSPTCELRQVAMQALMKPLHRSNQTSFVAKSTDSLDLSYYQIWK